MYRVKRASRRVIRTLTKPAALAVEYKLSPDLMGPALSLAIFIAGSMSSSWARFSKMVEIGGSFIWTPFINLTELAIYLMEAGSLIVVTTMFLAIAARHEDLKTFALCSLYMLIPLGLGRFATIPLILMSGRIVVDYTATNSTVGEAIFTGISRWSHENWLPALVVNLVGNLIPSIWAMLIQSLFAMKMLRIRGNAVFLILAAWISVELILVPILNAAAYGLKIPI